jgi:hypothetical protein
MSNRATATVASAPQSIWGLLQDELVPSSERPENSITPAELAQAKNLSLSYAHAMLRRKADQGILAAVKYRTAGRRWGICFVVAGSGGIATNDQPTAGTRPKRP